jgi:hypothetical protein
VHKFYRNLVVDLAVLDVVLGYEDVWGNKSIDMHFRNPVNDLHAPYIMLFVATKEN